MKPPPQPPSDTKALFRQCGTCAQTFAHLLNRDFGHNSEAHEKALDPLAGGILREGHQCGMLWGAALAVGSEASRQMESSQGAQALALSATQQVVDSFTQRTDTVNCREICKYEVHTRNGQIHAANIGHRHAQ